MSLIRSKQRVADHGEVFTPMWLVGAMLDLVKDESERINSRFLESACGSGNFLTQILKRKLAAVELKYGNSDFDRSQYAMLGLMCIYGIELLKDNIHECQANLLEIFSDYLDIDENSEVYRAASFVLTQNIVHGDALSMRTIEKIISLLLSGGTLVKASSNAVTSALMCLQVHQLLVRKVLSLPI